MRSLRKTCSAWPANTYFWRTYDQKELDCVEERAGRLFGYEFKWQGQVRQATRQEFMAAYPDAEVTTITRENFSDFIGQASAAA